MKTKITSSSVRFVTLMLCMMMIVGIMPVHAADTTSQYDFSAEDELDKYDSYTKRTANGTSDDSALPVGTEYVLATNYNTVNTDRPLPLDFYRYGAFLRDADEEQHYITYNLKDRTSNKDMPASVLTIYADPGVDFLICDVNGEEIADQDGRLNQSDKVAYFRKSSDNGHSVYYLELEGQKTGTSCTSITFTTSQNATPAHYSFWFGAPILVKGKTSSSQLVLFTSKPNTSTSTFPIQFYFSDSIADRTWLESVTVKKKYYESPDNCSSVYMSLRLPGDTSAKSQSLPSSGNLTFTVDISSTLNSKLAGGSYVFQLTNIRWLSQPVSNFMSYEGEVTLSYYQPFGYN